MLLLFGAACVPSCLYWIGLLTARAEARASDAAQVGTEFFLTVDASGTVGKGAQSGASLISLQQSQSIADLQTGQALIDDTVATHTLQIASLGRGLRDADAGIAAAMALGGALIVPDSNISVNFNLATYRGQQGFSGALIGRIAPKIYVTGGFAGSTRKGSTGGRVGIAFGL